MCTLCFFIMIKINVNSFIDLTDGFSVLKNLQNTNHTLVGKGKRQEEQPQTSQSISVRKYRL